MKSKTCGYCHEVLPLQCFSKCATAKGGLYNYCKPCAKKRVILSVYGLSPEDHAALINLQEGRCAICGKFPDTRGLFVDHDHTTGKVRGLLCVKCNTGLGMFMDSIDNLTGAISYLKRGDN